MSKQRQLRSDRSFFFLMDLLQDVAMLRPLVRICTTELGSVPELLVSSSFVKRDLSGTWRGEIDALCAETGARQQVFATPLEAVQAMRGRSGVLVSSTETNLPAHRVNHEVFRAAPSDFLRVTVQHGFECPGFLHNRDHDLAFGRNISFAADVLCGWSDAAALHSLAAAERNKLLVTGPPLLLQSAVEQKAVAPGAGLVCENLHSVRMRLRGDFRQSFMDVFASFADRLAAMNETVVVRPHPAGQFILKNNVELPPNLVLENRPAYKVPFGSFAFGISAASTVLVDMALSGIPTGIFQDDGGLLDVGNYAGLTVVSTVDDWLAFRRDALLRRDMLLEQQAAFLRGARLLTDPELCRARFTRLLAGVMPVRASAATEAPPPKPIRRVAFVANDFIPTLQLSFLKPLAALKEAGDIDWDLLTEEALKADHGDAWRSDTAFASWKQRLDDFKPDIMVFCRYSGPHADVLVEYARRSSIPTVFHLDDDLLNIPPEIGLRKWQAHNHPTRLASVRHLLNHVNLVYTSTGPLGERLRTLGCDTALRSGSIYCSGTVLNLAECRPVRRVGYMGFDHAHDFSLVVPALVRYLERHPEVEFELFGSIPKPPELDRFGARCRTVPPVREYAKFLERFASFNWDIGICPLADTPFNAVKANTKWVEYTSVGAAVIATRGTIYDGCIADGCGVLAGSEEEWLNALDRLTANPDERFDMVVRAQRRLEQHFSVERLRAQVLDVFAEASHRAAGGSTAPVRHLVAAG